MGRRFKILSDFDGVWTNQGPEAEVLFGHTIEALARLVGVSPQTTRTELADFRDAMARTPQQHGWAPDGRISAYVDEDPLVESSALCHVIATHDHPVARRYRDAVLSAFASMSAFSEDVFVHSTSAFRQEHPPCLVDDAAALMQALHDAGADVVVVSNSGADKISAWMQGAGIDAGPDAHHTVRVRGAAAKWRLGPTDETIEVDGRSIHVDRPAYRAAIEAEKPDLVIGDVFSLDLALPHVMRAAGHPAAPRKLVLRRHDHTPVWVTSSSAGGAIDHIVTSVAELPAIVRQS